MHTSAVRRRNLPPRHRSLRRGALTFLACTAAFLGVVGCSEGTSESEQALTRELTTSQWVAKGDKREYERFVADHPAQADAYTLDRMVFNADGTWTWGDKLSGKWSVVGENKIRMTMRQKGEDWTADMVRDVRLAGDELGLSYPDGSAEDEFVRATE